MKQLAFILALLTLYGCTCEELIPTVPEDPDTFIAVSTTTIFDGPDFVRITVQFNDFLDTQIPEMGANVSIEPVEDAYIEYPSTTHSGLHSFFYIYVNVNDDCSRNFPEVCPLTLTLRGDGNFPIVSLSGEVLDGDRNGSEGGNYEEEILLFQ